MALSHVQSAFLGGTTNYSTTVNTVGFTNLRHSGVKENIEQGWNSAFISIGITETKKDKILRCLQRSHFKQKSLRKVSLCFSHLPSLLLWIMEIQTERTSWLFFVIISRVNASVLSAYVGQLRQRPLENHLQEASEISHWSNPFLLSVCKWKFT